MRTSVEQNIMLPFCSGFIMLTKKQKTLLLLIDKKIKDTGIPPSYDEMKDSLGLASKSGIHRLITALEDRGFIRRLPNKARAIEVLKSTPKYFEDTYTPQPANDEFEIPFVGKIAAGNPIAAIEDSYNKISVPATMMGINHFALEVEGDSMIEAGILDGDIVVIKKSSTARNNQIVVALIDQEEATLKRIYTSENSIELIPENKHYETKVFGPDRVNVQGILVGLVRNYN